MNSNSKIMETSDNVKKYIASIVDEYPKHLTEQTSQKSQNKPQCKIKSKVIFGDLSKNKIIMRRMSKKNGLNFFN